jgi:hypothetical protein
MVHELLKGEIHMPETQTQNLHDAQTTQSAESIRNLVKRHNLRSGVNQADIDRFNKDLEQLAVGLEEQGKTQRQVERMHRERGEEQPPDPEITTAELVQKTIEESKKEDERRRAAGEPIPGEAPKPGVEAPKANINDPMANRLGMPAVPAQPTTAKRDHVETTVKKADDTVKKTTETASKK